MFCILAFEYEDCSAIDLLPECQSMLAMFQAALCCKHAVWDTPGQSSDPCRLVAHMISHDMLIMPARHGVSLLAAKVRTETST